MQLTNLLLLVSSAFAGQVTFVRPDTTQGSFSDAQGCYGIYPTVAKLLPFQGQAVQWFGQYACQGQPLKVSTGAEDFSPPLNALSARVINQSGGPTNPGQGQQPQGNQPQQSQQGGSPPQQGQQGGSPPQQGQQGGNQQGQQGGNQQGQQGGNQQGQQGGNQQGQQGGNQPPMPTPQGNQPPMPGQQPSYLNTPFGNYYLSSPYEPSYYYSPYVAPSSYFGGYQY